MVFCPSQSMAINPGGSRREDDGGSDEEGARSGVLSYFFLGFFYHQLHVNDGSTNWSSSTDRFGNTRLLKRTTTTLNPANDIKLPFGRPFGASAEVSAGTDYKGVTADDILP